MTNFYVLNNGIVKNEKGFSDEILTDFEYIYVDPDIKELNGYTIISDPINKQWEILKNIDETTYTSIKVSHDMQELNDILNLKLNDIDFDNYDNLKIDSYIERLILNNINYAYSYSIDEIEVLLFKDISSYIDWLMIDDESNITIESILNDGLNNPEKKFKQIIEDQFINDDPRIKPLENGMILFQYE